jgi:hypothetical protein
MGIHNGVVVIMSKSKSRQPSKQNAGKEVASTAVREGQSAAKSTVSAGSATSEKTASTSATNIATRPAQPTSKALSRDAAKYERRQAERQQRYLAQRRARRTKIFATVAAILVIALGSSLTWYFIYLSHHAGAQAASVPAPYQEAVYDSSNPPIDNIYCDQLEQFGGQHIHAHISIWISGQQYPLPQYVGIPQDSSSGSATCYYWLHTHDTTGVIHIETPVIEPLTLGQFLDEWNQQFSSLGFPSQLLLNSGWTIWVNGKVYHGSLDSVPLTAHALITVAYDSPNVKPDTTYAWNGL